MSKRQRKKIKKITLGKVELFFNGLKVAYPITYITPSTMIEIFESKQLIRINPDDAKFIREINIKGTIK